MKSLIVRYVSLLIFCSFVLPFGLSAVDQKETNLEKTKVENKQKDSSEVAVNNPPQQNSRRVNLNPSCISRESVIEDIRKSKEELENQKRELSAKEAELNAREKSILEELKKLEQMREEISKSQDQSMKSNEEKVDRLVETLLMMSPKAAAKVLTILDDHLAIAAILKMDTQKLGKILNLMDPSRSSRLSELMTGVHSTKKELNSMSNTQWKEASPNLVQKPHQEITFAAKEGEKK